MREATWDLLVGDVRTKLRTIPRDSVHCVVTSPPYWNLRDYSTPPQTWGDGWVGELGQEPYPERFVEHLVEVFGHVHRVLRPDGVCFVQMDDTMVDRELALVPQQLVIALKSSGWKVRCDLIWAPPNAMPESVTQRPTRAHEYLVMLTKGDRWFWDKTAVEEEGQDWTRGGPGTGIKETTHYGEGNGGNGGLSALAQRYKDGDEDPSRNIRSVWTMPTESFSGAHFAVMAKGLAEKCILAATSERGACASCGAQVVRSVDKRSIDRSELPKDHPEWRPRRYDEGKAGSDQSPGAGQRFSISRTLGWDAGCECGVEVVPSTVLDPFGGAMTTALVAKRLGRSSISIELSEEFAALGRERMATWWKDVRPKPADTNQLTLETT